jgi:hypothetical protein
VDIYGDYERSQLSPFHKSKMSLKGTLAYQSDPISAGIEVGQQTMENYVIRVDSASTIPADTSDAQAMMMSLFVRGKIIKDKLNFFARFDVFDPDANFKSNFTYSSGRASATETFITAGVDYTPVKNVHIMPNIWYNAYNDRSKNVSGKIKSDNDMALRLTFYYVYGK